MQDSVRLGRGVPFICILKTLHQLWVSITYHFMEAHIQLLLPWKLCLTFKLIRKVMYVSVRDLLNISSHSLFFNYYLFLKCILNFNFMLYVCSLRKDVCIKFIIETLQLWFFSYWLSDACSVFYFCVNIWPFPVTIFIQTHSILTQEYVFLVSYSHSDKQSVQKQPGEEMIYLVTTCY